MTADSDRAQQLAEIRAEVDRPGPNHFTRAEVTYLLAEVDQLTAERDELRRLFDQRPGGALRTLLIDAGIITETDRIGDARDKIRAYVAERDAARAEAEQLRARTREFLRGAVNLVALHVDLGAPPERILTELRRAVDEAAPAMTDTEESSK